MTHGAAYSFLPNMFLDVVVIGDDVVLAPLTRCTNGTKAETRAEGGEADRADAMSRSDWRLSMMIDVDGIGSLR
jgi:hypothetical protein